MAHTGKFLKRLTALIFAAVALAALLTPAAAAADGGGEPLWAENEAVFLADTRAEAELTAAAYGARLKSYAYGCGVLTDVGKVNSAPLGDAEAMDVLPELSHNYYVYADEAASYRELNDEYASKLWQLGAINAAEAWDYTRGAGVTVAVLDTGVQADHPDLSGQVAETRSFTTGDTCDYPPGDNNDNSGHGTHVAGIIAAVANNGIGVAGIAPEVTLISCKVLEVKDGKATGLYSDVISAINYAVGYGADVITMSLSGPSADRNLESAIKAAYSSGVVLLSAAGNLSSSTERYPAAYSQVIAVGSVGSDYRLSGFSNYGVWVDIMGPGGSVFSTCKDSTYVTKSGTSMATPAVAAAAALIKALRPAAAPATVRGILLGTTGREVDCGVCTTGLADALDAAVAAAVPAPVITVIKSGEGETASASVTITSAVLSAVNGTSDENLWYTTDGTDPASSSARRKYSGELTLDGGSSVTVCAVAEAFGKTGAEAAETIYFSALDPALGITGYSQPITYTGAAVSDPGYTALGGGAVTFRYYSSYVSETDNTPLPSAPSDPGAYIAVAYSEAGGAYRAGVSAPYEFTIAPADWMLTVTHNGVERWYTGDAVTLTEPGGYVISGSSDRQSITVNGTGVFDITLEGASVTAVGGALTVTDGSVALTLGEGTRSALLSESGAGIITGGSLSVTGGGALSLSGLASGGAVTITGGVTDVTGGISAQSVSISAGTVTVGSGVSAASVTITGGGVNASMGVRPTNGRENVYHTRMLLGLPGAGADALTVGGTAYGASCMYADVEGALHLWLPEGVTEASVSTGGNTSSKTFEAPVTGGEADMRVVSVTKGTGGALLSYNGDALSAAVTDGGELPAPALLFPTGWQDVTVDQSLSGLEITRLIRSGLNVTISFTGAASAPGAYVSGILTDTAGNIVAYCRLWEASGSGSGVLGLTLPERFEADGLTLSLFTEKNGRAGAPVTADLTKAVSAAEPQLSARFDGGRVTVTLADGDGAVFAPGAVVAIIQYDENGRMLSYSSTTIASAAAGVPLAAGADSAAACLIYKSTMTPYCVSAAAR